VEVYREAGGSSGAVRQVLVGAGDDLDAEATPLLRISRALADQPVDRKHNRTG
jgi:hypothetical protein